MSDLQLCLSPITVDFLVSCFVCGNPENSLCSLQAPGYSELSPFCEKKAFFVLLPFKHPAFGFMWNVTETHIFLFFSSSVVLRGAELKHTGCSPSLGSFLECVAIFCVFGQNWIVVADMYSSYDYWHRLTWFWWVTGFFVMQYLYLEQVTCACQWSLNTQ